MGSECTLEVKRKRLSSIFKYQFIDVYGVASLTEWTIKSRIGDSTKSARKCL